MTGRSARAVRFPNASPATRTSSAPERLLHLLFGEMPLAQTGRWSDEEWRDVVAEAERREVEALAFARVQSGAIAATPAAREALELLYCRGALRAQLVARQLTELLAAFTASGIPVIALKGACLAHTVYADAALRRMSDIDLLIRRADDAPAREVMSRLGFLVSEHAEPEAFYAEHHHGAPFARRGSVPVELHHALVPPDAPFRLDVDALWARAVPFDVGGVRTRGLAPLDQLLHLALHAGYTHDWGAGKPRGLPLRVVVDVARCVAAFGAGEWASAAAHANAAGAGRYVYCALRLARDVAGARVPADALEALDHDAGDDEVVELVREGLRMPSAELPPFYARMTTSRTLREALRALYRAAFGRQPASGTSGGPRAPNDHVSPPRRLVAGAARVLWAAAGRAIPGEAGRRALAHLRRRVALTERGAAPVRGPSTPPRGARAS